MKPNGTREIPTMTPLTPGGNSRTDFEGRYGLFARSPEAPMSVREAAGGRVGEPPQRTLRDLLPELREEGSRSAGRAGATRGGPLRPGRSEAEAEAPPAPPRIGTPDPVGPIVSPIRARPPGPSFCLGEAARRFFLGCSETCPARVWGSRRWVLGNIGGEGGE
jgi:hypothetical protein